MTMEVIPVSPALAAEICGVNVSRPLDASTVAEIHKAWLEHLVLLIRGQDLDEEAFCRFSAIFGELEHAPPNEAKNTTSGGYVPDSPEITVISNVIVDGVEIGSLGAGECAWHTDMSYNSVPPSASCLYALEVPTEGGATGFLNMYAAYETLPRPLKEAIAGKTAIHDTTYTSAGSLRKGYEPVDDVRKAPGARHPLLRTHPETGRTALFLGRRQNSYIVGLPVDESEALLDEIWAHATQDKFTWHHHWKKGDLIVWDNRCAMHVRHAFDPAARRIMHRTQIKGDAPFYKPEQPSRAA